MRLLVSLQVEGLLGRFNHSIEFPADWDFVIVHGPNGVGKTKLLELIDAVATARFERLTAIPFQTAVFLFDDGATLRLRRVTGETSDGGNTETKTLVTVRSDEITLTDWEATRSARVASMGHPMVRNAVRRLPVDQIGEDEFHDLPSGTVLSWLDVLERYESQLPPQVLRRIGLPPEIIAFMRDFKVHLIESQRLFVLDRETPQRGNQPTVITFARDLAQRLSAASAQNSRASAQLDRTFPRRILEAGGLAPNVTEDVIRKRYEDQNTLRSRLAEIDVLDPVAELPLPDRELEDWQRLVLATYLDDTESKLATFQWLLDRVGFLRETITSRFLFKKVLIDRERGLRFVTFEGTEIGAELLSTGEQHELVLTYDLLFNVEPDTLVLIDEPEISLHVAWQQTFLEDISRIAKLVGIRFMIATHSPQIVNKSWDRTVPLYDEH